MAKYAELQTNGERKSEYALSVICSKRKRKVREGGSHSRQEIPRYIFLHNLRACLLAGRVIPASGLALAGGEKIARVYELNCTGRVTLQLNARLHSTGLETSRKLTRVGGLLDLESLQQKNRVYTPVRVTTARR